jgi:MFS transporter, DHA1 family, inner membrane transport protein
MSQQSRFPLFRLLVISGAIFVSVSSEFLPTGLLPDIAGDLRVSESQVGLLVTIFAFTVALTTVPLTRLTQRFSRKWLMVGLLLVFAVANVLAGLSQTYEFLVFARVLGGLAHGLFWAVTGPYASRLVTRKQLVRALSVTNAGGTAAFILGVPIGTALGHALGWQVAFFVMAGVVLVFTTLVVLYLPPVDHRHVLTTGEIGLPGYKDRTIPAVVAACILCIIIMLGQNSFNTYVAPWIIGPGGFSADSIAPLLFVTGIFGALGLFLSGVFGDRYPRGTFSALLVLVGVAMVLLAVFSGTQWFTVVLFAMWGIAIGGLPSLLHGRVLGSASPRIRDLASAALTVSFNLAIGGGALLGGILLDAFGVEVLPWAYATLVVVALIVGLVEDLRNPHRHRIQETSSVR